MTNRFVIEGLLSEAAQGKRVLFLTDRHWEALGAYTDARRANPRGASFVGSSGREEVRFASGGSLAFMTTAQVRFRLRGSVYDLVYIDPDAERALRDRPDLLDDIRVVLAASRGELLRA